MNNPIPRSYWFCKCPTCGWESEAESNHADLNYVECPECHSDYIVDEEDYFDSRY